MKKIKNCFRKSISIILIFVVCINTFAAVVDSSDGSVFITKAEFESMKDDFNKIIDEYNTSISTKIDGAIANYIAGLNLAKYNKKSIILSNKTDYIMSNGSFDNEYKFPDINIALSLTKFQINNYEHGGSASNRTFIDNLFNGHQEYIPFGIPSTYTLNGTVGLIHKNFWLYGSGKYERASKSNVRNVVTDPKLSDYTYKSGDPIVWYGQAQNKYEKWQVLATLDFSSGFGILRFGGDPGYLYETYNNAFYLGNCLRLSVSGRLPDFSNKNNRIWSPTVRWKYNSNQISWGPYTNNYIGFNNTPSVQYLTNDSSKTWEYQNLGIWSNSKSFECELYDNPYYANYSTINTNNTEDWYNAFNSSDIQSYWTGIEYRVRQRTDDSVYVYPKVEGYKWMQEAYWTDGINDTSTGRYQIPQLGLLPNTFTSANIYQYYDTLYDSNGDKVPNLTLNEGFPLCPVSIDEEITWEPVFSKITASGHTGDDLEAEIVLSYEPFTNGKSIADTSDYVDIDGYVKGSTFPETTDKKAKISFTADRNGYVYAKWYPKLSSAAAIDSTSWEAVLDVPKCNTYISVK